MGRYLNVDLDFQLQKQENCTNLEAQIVRFPLITLDSVNRG